jgi:hypothetical protein
MRLRSALLASLFLLACGAPSDVDGGLLDAGLLDAGDVDAGLLDAGAPDAGGLDAGQGDAGLADAGTVDAGHDAGAVDAGPLDAGHDAGVDAGVVDAGPLPSCLGTAEVLTLAGRSPYVTATVVSSPGAFLVDFASTASMADVNGFATPPTPTSCSGGWCTFSNFDFFGSWGSVTLGQADFSGLGSTPKQAGIIGTDFLSLNPFTLDVVGHQLIRGAASSFCTATQLSTAGFTALDTTGFYSDNLADLVPMSSVSDGGTGSVPNVPTVKLRVAGVVARAQVDTGFDDSVVPHSININDAFYTAITSAAPGSLVRAPTLDLTLSTCVGGTEKVLAYRLASGQAAELVGLQGQGVHADATAVLFVKHTLAATQPCGGISTWSVPAAQLSASLLFEAGATVFDPWSARVWVR